jgi:HK97 family phage prohead protease
MDRAYSILDIKSVKEDERIIKGIASTPSTDRMGDIVESEGAKFKLPLPLLWQHNSREPVGWVTAAKPTKDGIPITATFAKVDEPGELKNSTDKAWQATKLGLTTGLSIGFTVNSYEIMKEGGLRIKDWDWLELSVVTIPANQDATISMVRSLDEELRAGKQRDVGAAGIPPKPPLKIKERVMPRTNQEKLREAEARRASLTAQMTALMDAADEKGEALDAEQDEKWTGFKGEVDQLDKHIGRLQDMERINVTRAAPVRGAEPAEAAESRSGGRETSGIVVRQREVERWRPFVRLVLANARAQGNWFMAGEIAKANEQWMAETPEVAGACKAAVAVGTTSDATWAGPLVQYQNLTEAFAEYLRPLTLIGRIPGLRNVPFKVRVPRMTGASTVNWVGEAAPKPLSALAFDSITLDFAKIAGDYPAN